MAGKGPASDWVHECSDPNCVYKQPKTGFYADWNHRHEEAPTQEEANEKLYQWFKSNGYKDLE